jgi:hypothetical protein
MKIPGAKIFAARERRFKNFFLCIWAFVGLLMIGCCGLLHAGENIIKQPWGSVDVVIKYGTTLNGSGPATVFLRDKKTGKEVKVLTLDDIYLRDYHAAEYRNRHLYIIRRLGGPHSAENDQLWRYNKDGSGSRVWSGPNLDFRVRKDNRLIAVTSFHIQSSDHESMPKRLLLMSSAGTVMKEYAAPESGEGNSAPYHGDFEFNGCPPWTGRMLWVKDQETVDIYGFFRIDTVTLKMKEYGVNVEDTDLDLNTHSLLLAYSDYPPIFDDISQDEFDKAKTPVKLYIHNLATGKERVIARSKARKFDPVWINAHTLEYNNPNGKGRIKKTID